MNKKTIQIIILGLMATIWPSLVMAAGSVTVSAESTYANEEIARSNAVSKLRSLCIEKGLYLYEGKFHRDSVSFTFGALQYSGLGCGKKCRVKVTGRCKTKDSEVINIACSKKRVRGWAIGLPGGAMRIFTDNGDIINIKAASISNGSISSDLVASICEDKVEPSYITKLQKYFYRKIKNQREAFQKSCDEQKKKSGKLPDECKSKLTPSASIGVVGGVRQ